MMSATEQRVSIGGRHLTARTQGEGPVVVLEPGASGGGVYGRVIEEVAQFATVLTYDRAGVRESDPPAADPTVEDISSDLHLLLEAMAIERPVILVGWSLTGLSALIHPLLYPNDVRGIILIDPTPFTLFDHPDRAGPLKDPEKAVRNAKLLARLGYGKWWGTSAMVAWLRKNCGPNVDEKSIRDYARSLTNITRYGALGELRKMRQSCDVTMKLIAEHNFPQIPLIVLSAQVDTSISSEASTAKHANHKAIAELSALGRYVPIQHGSHMMTLDRPDAIVSALKEVVLTASELPSV